MDPTAFELPPPPPPRERSAARGPHPSRPAGRSRLVAGALSVLAFLGLGAGMAATSTSTSAGSTQLAAGSIQPGSETDDGLGTWRAAFPSQPSQATTPITSTHGS